MTTITAEIERLCAAAGERDALREAVSIYDEFVSAYDAWAISVGFGNDAFDVMLTARDKLHQELIAVPAQQPPADDRLAWAEAGAKAMRDYLVIREKQDGPLSAYEIEESDPAVIARRAVTEQEKP